jgi:hypothetical protein
MSAADHSVFTSQADRDVRADHVPRHEISFPCCCATRAPACTCGDAGPAHRQGRVSAAYGRCGQRHRGAPALGRAGALVETQRAGWSRDGPARPAGSPETVAPGGECPGRSLVSGLPRPDLHRINVTALAEAAIAVLPPGVLGGQAFVMAVPGIWE